MSDSNTAGILFHESTVERLVWIFYRLRVVKFFDQRLPTMSYHQVKLSEVPRESKEFPLFSKNAFCRFALKWGKHNEASK